jgi:hypothetical protein
MTNAGVVFYIHIQSFGSKFDRSNIAPINYASKWGTIISFK